MKAKLHSLIRAARDKEAADLLPHVDDSGSRSGRWTAKDQLAHLASWRLINAAELEALRTGGEAPQVAAEDDDENGKIYAQTHDLPAAEVLDMAGRSWDTFAAAVEACSEEDLLKPRPRRPQQHAWNAVPNNTYFHLAEHLAYWRRDDGDVAGALGAMRWGAELARATFPDSPQTAAAVYNLGCMYAKDGDAAGALPYLRAAFEADPALLDWAPKDTDLDPIRSDPEVVSLLGGR